MTCSIVGCECDYFREELTSVLFAEVSNDVACCRQCKHQVKDHKRKEGK
jgi:hypothetical protein